MPPRSFNALLKELIGALKARAIPGAPCDPPWADNPIPQQFDDDIAHLRRWLDFGEADKIWNEISGGQPFNSGDALAFVTYILAVRRAAEQADSAARKTPLESRRVKQLAAKVRRLAVRRLTQNEITAEQFAALVERTEQALRRRVGPDPLLTNRSDKNGSRKRTIFCRELSDHLHDLTGQWHDPVVEMLCHVALGGDVDARSARRESTRKRYR